MRIFLIIFQVIYVLALIPWLIMTLVSPMIFDAGVTAARVSIVGILVAYPIVAVICSILAWRLRLKRKLVSLLVNLIPFLWVIAIPLVVFGEALATAFSTG